MTWADPPITPKGHLVRVPNQPRTPHKSFRIPEDLYVAALAAAQQRGETLAAVVRRSLRDYVAGTNIS